MKFSFQTQEQLTRRVYIDVEANSEEEAMQKAKMGQTTRREIVPNSERIDDVEITCIIEEV